MWHKDQKSLCALLYWPLSMRPQQHDGFVLIGLCWLYGRNEVPPPPPLHDGNSNRRLQRHRMGFATPSDEIPKNSATKDM